MRTIVILLFVFAITSCTTHVDQIAPCAVSPDSIRYFTHVYPIIDRTCAIPTCHVSGFEYGNFENVSEVRSVANSGKLEYMITTRQMPSGITRGKSILTDCEITIIRTWIHNGATVN